MPHLVLQYSKNVDQDINFGELFSQLHEILANVGGVNLDACKSRAIGFENYCIAQGEANNAFVHLDVRIFEGRSVDLKQEIGRQILSLLREFYSPSIEKHNMQITVELQDIQRECYFK